MYFSNNQNRFSRRFNHSPFFSTACKLLPLSAPMLWNFSEFFARSFARSNAFNRSQAISLKIDASKRSRDFANRERPGYRERRWRSFFPRLANSRGGGGFERRGQRRKRGSRPLLHSPLTRTAAAGALAEARRHHSQTQTVAEAAKNRDELPPGGVWYIEPPNATNDRTNESTNLPTYAVMTRCDRISSSQLYRQFRATLKSPRGRAFSGRPNSPKYIKMGNKRK